MVVGWRRKQAEKLKEHLYETALGLFREQGYESTTVAQITRRAGVAKGTFFNYFPSKDHVLACWYREITLSVLRRCRERAFPSAEEAVQALAAGLGEAGTSDPGLFAAKARNWSDTVTGEEEALDQELQRYIAEEIGRGKAEGEVSPALDVDFFAKMVLAMLTGTGQNWVVANCGFDLNEALESRVAYLFATARGRRGSTA
jgi:AcrR family transcriptional regulator